MSLCMIHFPPPSYYIAGEEDFQAVQYGILNKRIRCRTMERRGQLNDAFSAPHTGYTDEIVRFPECPASGRDCPVSRNSEAKEARGGVGAPIRDLKFSRAYGIFQRQDFSGSWVLPDIKQGGGERKIKIFRERSESCRKGGARPRIPGNRVFRAGL